MFEGEVWVSVVSLKSDLRSVAVIAVSYGIS